MAPVHESVVQVPESPLDQNRAINITVNGFASRNILKNEDDAKSKPEMTENRDAFVAPNGGVKRSHIIPSNQQPLLRRKPTFPMSEVLPSFRKYDKGITVEKPGKPPKTLKAFRQLTSTFKFDGEHGRDRSSGSRDLETDSEDEGESSSDSEMRQKFGKVKSETFVDQYANVGTRPLPIRQRRRQENGLDIRQSDKHDSENTPWPGAFRELRNLYPTASSKILVDALAKCGGDAYDAASMITDRGLLESVQNSDKINKEESSEDEITTPKQTGAKKKSSTHGERKSSPKYEEVKKSSKRVISQQSQRKIREKYKKETKRDAIQIQSSPEEPPPRKRKLVNKAAASKAFNLTTEESGSGKEEIVEVPSDSDPEPEINSESYVLEFLNTQSVDDLMDLGDCTEDIANVIIERRPWNDLNDVYKLNLKNTNSKHHGTNGEKLVDTLTVTLEGFRHVDELITRCENVGQSLLKEEKQLAGGGDSDMNLVELDFVLPTQQASNTAIERGEILTEQPCLMSDDVKLKPYQLVGVNWLLLLYRKGLSGILADEMGLGKTCQVVAFLAQVIYKGNTGPHLVVVPSSTIENWMREFERFCPAIDVEVYYGSQAEREEIRYELEDRKDYQVIVTTYNLATGSKEDRSFLRSRAFDVCIYDEGHMLKNNQSARYRHLMKLKARRRLLLTGTPIQNNLRELMSLLGFILPQIFAGSQGVLNEVFKIRGLDLTTASEVTEFSARRIDRARRMMKPFILRRRKAMVLDDIPNKDHFVEYCPMTVSQNLQYELIKTKAEGFIRARELGQVLASKDRGNIVMDMRKAANHPMLFRIVYNDKMLREMAQCLMNEPQYRIANFDYLVEDMEVMSDFELHRLCLRYPNTIGSFACYENTWMDAGKVQKLAQIIPEMRRAGDRILLFSQFTQVLDILEEVLNTLDVVYTRLDGQTSVDVRQDLIDQFHEDKSITVFLLSTKAGGFGINLACANVVILYDSSFNPHDDKQAEDRAHRVGQQRDVTVIRLISKGTIEEHILKLGITKLALDKSVSEDDTGNAATIERGGEKAVMLMMAQEIDMCPPSDFTNGSTNGHPKEIEKSTIDLEKNIIDLVD